VGASVAEWDARADYQVGDGAGDEHLAGLCCGRDPGAGVDGDAGQVVTGGFDLAGVQADPDFDAQGADRIAHRAGAADRAGGAVKAANKPSPAVSISRPPNRSSSARKIA
jgi:hypothetical protein